MRVSFLDRRGDAPGGAPPSLSRLSIGKPRDAKSYGKGSYGHTQREQVCQKTGTGVPKNGNRCAKKAGTGVPKKRRPNHCLAPFSRKCHSRFTATDNCSTLGSPAKS